MIRVRPVAAVALAVVAVLAALLAADVRGWPAALDRGDALYAIAPARAQWTAPGRLGGLAGSILGTAGELSSRRALALYAKAIVDQATLPFQEEVETARVYATAALAAPAASGDAAIASQARTLQGVLAADAASRGGGVSQVDAAIGDFIEAIRLEPENEAAKFDLELLLRLGKVQPSVYPSRAKAFGRTARSGAQASLPGHGY